MNTPLSLTCEAAFEAASTASKGFLIETNSTFRARVQLYKWRAESSRKEEFKNIYLRLSDDDPEHQILLIKLPQGENAAKYRKTESLIKRLTVGAQPQR